VEYAPPLAFITDGIVLAGSRLGTAVEAELNAAVKRHPNRQRQRLLSLVDAASCPRAQD